MVHMPGGQRWPGPVKPKDRGDKESRSNSQPSPRWERGGNAPLSIRTGETPHRTVALLRAGCLRPHRLDGRHLGTEGPGTN